MPTRWSPQPLQFRHLRLARQRVGSSTLRLEYSIGVCRPQVSLSGTLVAQIEVMPELYVPTGIASAKPNRQAIVTRLMPFMVDEIEEFQRLEIEFRGL